MVNYIFARYWVQLGYSRLDHDDLPSECHHCGHGEIICYLGMLSPPASPSRHQCQFIIAVAIVTSSNITLSNVRNGISCKNIFATTTSLQMTKKISLLSYNWVHQLPKLLLINLQYTIYTPRQRPGVISLTDHSSRPMTRCDFRLSCKWNKLPRPTSAR